MQLASYLPIINIPIAENVAVFSRVIAEIVTFDIPDIDMESVSMGALECPENDTILTELEEVTISDQTTIKGIPWSELKLKFASAPKSER